MKPIIIILLLAIYIIGTIIFWSIYFRKVKQERKPLVELGTYLSLLIPVIGFIFSYFVVARFKRKKLTPIELTTETKVIRNWAKVRSEGRKGRTIIPVSLIETLNEEEQKKLLLDIQKTPLRKKGALLQYAFQTENTETVHYASTIFEQIRRNYQIEIRNQEEQNQHGDAHTTLDLLNLYDEVIESGVFPDLYMQTIKIKRDSLIESYVDVLSQFVSGQKTLAHYYVESKQYKKALYYYQRLIYDAPHEADGYIGCLQMYYEQKQWHSFHEVFEQFEQHVNNEDKELYSWIYYIKEGYDGTKAI